MPVIDILVLTAVLVSFLFGAWRGLVREALSLFFWIGGAVVAGMFNEALAVKLGFIGNPAFERIAAFVIIFVAIVFIGAFISNMISKLTSAAGLKATDRALGALFGIFRGVIIATLVVMLTLPFPGVSQYYSDSWTVPYLSMLADYFVNLSGLGQGVPAGA